jgi:hypothetical protein
MRATTATRSRFDQRHADLDLGLADLSIAVLARKLDTRRILTFDERPLSRCAAPAGRNVHAAPRRWRSFGVRPPGDHLR